MEEIYILSLLFPGKLLVDCNELDYYMEEYKWMEKYLDVFYKEEKRKDKGKAKCSETLQNEPQGSLSLWCLLVSTWRKTRKREKEKENEKKVQEKKREKKIATITGSYGTSAPHLLRWAAGETEP